GREPAAVGPVHRTASRSAPGPANVASEWLPSLRLSSVSSSFSCVLSVILTAERSLHFQLRQNTGGIGTYRTLPPFSLARTATSPSLCRTSPQFRPKISAIRIPVVSATRTIKRKRKNVWLIPLPAFRYIFS